MDLKTRLASLFTLSIVGTTVAWTAMDEYARREFARLVGWRDSAVTTSPSLSSPMAHDGPRRRESQLLIGPRAGPLESQTWSCPTCEVRLHIDPALPRGATAECEISCYGAEPESRDLVRLGIALQPDGSARVSVQLFDLCENDRFQLALPRQLSEGARLELSGSYFSDLGELIDANAPDAPLADRLLPYDSLAGTLTLGSTTLEPGSDVALRLELTSDGEGRRTASRHFLVTGVAQVLAARPPAQRGK